MLICFKMARKDTVGFKMVYKLAFKTPIRDHHVYKATWNAKIEEQLVCHEDTRKEAKKYDEHAFGVFKTSKQGKENVVGQVLWNYFNY